MSSGEQSVDDARREILQLQDEDAVLLARKGRIECRLVEIRNEISVERLPQTRFRYLTSDQTDRIRQLKELETRRREIARALSRLRAEAKSAPKSENATNRDDLLRLILQELRAQTCLLERLAGAGATAVPAERESA